MRRPYLPGRARRRAGRRVALIVVAGAVAAGAALPAAAAATAYCVGFDRSGCETRATAAQAFADAAGGDRIELGALTATAPLDDAGRALDVVGSGEALTVLGDLTLSAPGSQLTGATVDDLQLTGTAAQVRVTGVATLHASAALRAATVVGSGGVDAAGGTPRLESVALDLTGGPGLRVGCATLHARHVTLVGTPDAAVTTACSTSEVRVSDSVLWVADPFAGPRAVVTEYTDYPAAPDHADGPGDRHLAPGFAAGGLRPAAGSPLLDAGTPGALADADWPEDGDRLPRAADGDGDGVPVRDMGAFERPAPAVPVPAGNLLRDPGAEEAGAWAFTGGFARERYGAFPFPSAAAGAALSGGGAFFAGGPGPAGAAGQVVDVTGLAPEIDLGGATAALSGLLGGYRADGDAGRVEATFLDPAGQPLGTVALVAPAAAERANATTLLPRARSDAVPPLTRAIAVALRATRVTGGYDDAYFDNLALTVAAPGAPPLPPGGGPGGPALKPFAGLRVLTGSARVDRRGRIAVRLACVDGTVGSCAGALTLTGALRKGERARRVGLARATVRPGTTRRLRVRLSRAARQAVRKRRRIRMTLFAAARDGQGLTRVSTVPVTVQRAKPPRRR